jgi:hypothetical protein
MYSPIWEEFGIQHLYIMLLSLFVCHEMIFLKLISMASALKSREGLTLLMGVNEIAFMHVP